jgi:hypothetical protein
MFPQESVTFHTRWSRKRLRLRPIKKIDEVIVTALDLVNGCSGGSASILSESASTSDFD